jgi:hypothetical protein
MAGASGVVGPTRGWALMRNAIRASCSRSSVSSSGPLGSSTTTASALGGARVVAGNGDATSLLADAALVVQQLTGVATEPVVVSPDGVAKMGREAGPLVVGISDKWRVEGLRPIHSEIVHAFQVDVLSCGAGRALGSSPGPRSDVSFLARHRHRHLNVCGKERGSRCARSRTHGSCSRALVSLDRADRPAASPHRLAGPGARPQPSAPTRADSSGAPEPQSRCGCGSLPSRLVSTRTLDLPACGKVYGASEHHAPLPGAAHDRPPFAPAARRNPLVGSVQERQAGQPEPRALCRRLLAGFLTDGSPPVPGLARRPPGAPLSRGGL